MRHNSRYLALSFLILFLSFFQSCFIADFTQLTYTTFPAQKDTIIGADDPVWIDFSMPLIKVEAENNFIVTASGKSCKGDLSWQDDRLIFTPAADWLPGTRYLFQYSGQVETTDGREFTLAVTVPFFSVTAELPPQLLTGLTSPASGAQAAPDAVLRFQFDKDMDTALSILDFFSITPQATYLHAWETPRILAITPLSPWSAYTTYTWSVDTNLTDATGIPLVSSYDGNFIIQNETTPAPVVEGVHPVLPSWEDGFDDSTGATLSTTGSRNDSWISFKDAIRIDFENPDQIDLASLQDSFSLNPYVKGTIHRVGTDPDIFFVFVPDSGARFLIDTLYKLTISNELENTSGVPMQDDFTVWFKANTEYLAVTSVIFDQQVAPQTLITDFNSYAATEINFPPAVPPTVIRITFDHAIDTAEAASVIQYMEWERVLPGGGPYGAVDIAKPDSYNLVVTFDGNFTYEAGNMFRLSIPGGSGGLVLESGAYLQTAFFLYITYR